MPLLVTFSNQYGSPRFTVAIVDPESGLMQWVDLPDDFTFGAAGAAFHEDGCFVACQSGGVVAFDTSLKPRAFLPTTGASGLHSILFDAQAAALDVVSADDDTVYRYHLSADLRSVRSSEVLFCADTSGSVGDNHHVNSIVEFRGDIHVSMFGPAPRGSRHIKRSQGAIVRIKDRKLLADDLLHPHTLAVLDDELFIVESRGRRFRRVVGRDQRTWPIEGGYPRGLAPAGPGRVWIGASARRRHSASSGVRVDEPGTDAIDFRCRLVEVDLDHGETGKTIDLTGLATEIYDIVPLPDGFPFQPEPDEARQERILHMRETYGELFHNYRMLEQRYENSLERRLRRLTSGGVSGLVERIRVRLDGKSRRRGV